MYMTFSIITTCISLVDKFCAFFLLHFLFLIILPSLLHSLCSLHWVECGQVSRMRWYCSVYLAHWYQEWHLSPRYCMCDLHVHLLLSYIIHVHVCTHGFMLTLYVHVHSIYVECIQSGRQCRISCCTWQHHCTEWRGEKNSGKNESWEILKQCGWDEKEIGRK